MCADTLVAVQIFSDVFCSRKRNGFEHSGVSICKLVERGHAVAFFLSRPQKRAFLRSTPLQNGLFLPVKWQDLDLESGAEGGENENCACARGIHELPPLAR